MIREIELFRNPPADVVLTEAHAQVLAASPPELAALILDATADSDRCDRRAVLGRLAAVALAALAEGVQIGGER